MDDNEPHDDDNSSGEWPEAGAERPFDDADSQSETELDSGFQPPTHVFFENEALIRVLNDPRRGENDSELAMRLFAALLDATLIALIPEEQELGESVDGEMTLEGDLELSFILVRHPDVDGEIVPMFTDEGSLGSFMPDGGRYVALVVRDLFPLLGNSPGGPPNIVVNPGGNEALLLTPRMVQDIIDSARGYGTRMIDEDTDVEVTPAEKPMPDDVLAGLRTLLAEHEAVVRCTQVQWFMPDRHEEPTLVLAVELVDELEGDERRFVLAQLWRTLSPLLRTLERQVEMVDFAAQRERLAGVIDSVKPFYERGQ